MSFFKRLLALIQAATDSIHLRTFLWRNDHYGSAIARALIDAADRGVQIHILKDPIGALFEHTEENGCSLLHPQEGRLTAMERMFLAFYPNRQRESDAISDLRKELLNHPNIDARTAQKRWDHGKVWIFDHKILVSGGMNLEERTFDRDRFGQRWHDFMIEIHDRETIERYQQHQRQVSPPTHSIDFLSNGSVETPAPIGHQEEHLTALLQRARHRIVVHMAYWGHPGIANTLLEIAQRGVDIIILTAHRSNIWSDRNRNLLGNLARQDPRIRIYGCPHMVHAKAFLVDTDILYVGSLNFVRSAMDRTREFGVVLQPPSSTVRNQFEKCSDSLIEAANDWKPDDTPHYSVVRAGLQKLLIG